MKPINPTTFLTAAAEHGIGVDPTYAHHWPRNLAFLHHPHPRPYWIPPEDPRRLPAFIAAVIGSLEPWNHLVLWPKCVPFDAVLRGEDVPELTRIADALPALASDGGVEFDRSETAPLSTLIGALSRHGWSWPTDVYLVPDSFDVILMVDHHEALHARFASDERCSRFVHSMRACGFELPDEPSDPTTTTSPDGPAT